MVWREHPDARQELSFGRWVGKPDSSGRLSRPVLMPGHGAEDTYDTIVEFLVFFLHPTENRPMSPIESVTAGYAFPNYVPIDVNNVDARVRFTTADGVRWETQTEGSGGGKPERASR